MSNKPFNFLEAIRKEGITVEECLYIWMRSNDVSDEVGKITAKELIKSFPDRSTCEIPTSKKKIIGWLQNSLTQEEQEAIAITTDSRVAGKHFQKDSNIQPIRDIARNAFRKLNKRFEKLMELTYGSPDTFIDAPEIGNYYFVLLHQILFIYLFYRTDSRGERFN